MRRGPALAALATFSPTLAAAHVVVGGPHGPPTWSFEPWAVIPLALTAALYAIGQARLGRRVRHGRSERRRAALLFWSGWLSLALAVVSPLHEAGGSSFAAHMIEHEILMLVAAPLLVASRPLAVLMWAFPGPARAWLGAVGHARGFVGGWALASHPAVATALQATALWVWHLPGLFDLALRHEGWHAAQHLSFFITALLFWSAMIGPRRNAWTAAACLFATSMISGALGAAMALSPSPWYAAYAALGLTPFGLTPAEDQQLAGALMWAPGGVFHAVVAAVLLAGVLRDRPSAEAAR
jgi:putative membrane protein